ncbi:class I SAM-dependent methyltransferase [Brevibacillus laterosporus]|uniref:class I SAM-dependent methyltransferase n=1 Tax=Brevibacillus laterosporus TaxID=1465 RepID=UPI002655FD5C|nr:class I SAM-dependent methyltransferase [Brevibacillus laterosporus]MDN9009362.1 class I SAM-dependent methyltransferase [Brevibacillus laterosporus]MDO0940131.1 class I SAM-dependent methyltransferase [Brevibacillus laterosporus]
MAQPNHPDIYQNQAEKYERLISKQPSLYAVINQIKPIENTDIIDLGAGTGRLTTVLAKQAKSIVALDASEAMLQVTAHKLKQAGLHNWRTQVADHRALPVANDSADLLVSGWSIGYLSNSTDPTWKHNIKQVMAEIKRVLRPGGTAIILETMGTGHETPHPPIFLQDYYRSLEQDYGFSFSWIRLDYHFESVEEAADLTRFFFGEEVAEKVVSQSLLHVPECAGIWTLQV